MKLFVVFFVFIHCCTLFLGCKKEAPFSEFEGKWKPVSYNNSQGIKSFGPQYVYFLNSEADSLIYRNYNQQGNVLTELKYKLQFSIQTVIKDNSILVIEERYQGLDTNGNVVVNLSNKNEVNLVEGQSEYGHSTKNQSIKADRIKTYTYDWSGMNFYITSTEFIRY